MDVMVYGGDSETLEGKPMTFQFFSHDVKMAEIMWVNEHNATKKFIGWCDKLRTKTLHVVYVHNLEFDLPEFFYDVRKKLLENGSDFSFTVGGWSVTGCYGKPTFCKLHNRSRNCSVVIVDSHAWYAGSLASAAQLFCPDLPKLKRPRELGSKQFKPSDENFVAYAMRDAEIDYHIGSAIQKIHREFEIPQAVSLAHMASHIFRKRFLDYTIPQPTKDIISAALASYHGGKNNILVDASPRWHLGISSIDISSAYPYGMAQLPSMANGKLYRRISRTSKAPREIADLGVYQVSGKAAQCDYPCLFTHGFDPIQGAFRDTWIQGYELNEALRSGEVKLTSFRGFYYDAEKDNRPPALRAFVEEFYERKSKEKDKVLRHMWKIILNALYGKFIQTRKTEKVFYSDIDSGESLDSSEVVAGGLFHPFIASATTAHTRAFIHQAEHQHKAIHTATDGLFTYARKARRVPMAAEKGLGALELEHTDKDLLLVRNKCYVLYGKKPDKPPREDTGPWPSKAFAGKWIYKAALHGFQGNKFDLERLVATNRRSYTVTRPNKLKESVRRGLQVNKFEEHPFTLKVGPILVAE